MNHLLRFFAIVFCGFVPFICSSIKRCGLFFQRHKLLSDSTHCRRLRFCFSDRSVCTSFKQKCSYLKHCHGDLKVSFISAQKLCCAINGESKYLLSSMQSMVMRREIGNVLLTKSNIWFFVYISCIFKQLQAGIKFYSASGNSFHYKVIFLTLYLEFPGCGRSAGS